MTARRVYIAAGACVVKGSLTMAKRMRDRVTEICEQQVDRLAEAEREERCSRKYRPTAPHIGDTYLPEQYDDVVRKVAKAIAATAWHERTAPYSWANPLPLKMEWCETLIDNKDNALKLLGYFGRSMRWNDWDFEQHPTFPDFCSGVLDYIFCPPEIQMDLGLQRMFPPRPLDGITTPLQWRAPRLVSALSGGP
jgi:hypothetical protein